MDKRISQGLVSITFKMLSINGRTFHELKIFSGPSEERRPSEGFLKTF